jgi:hypothetical protein
MRLHAILGKSFGWRAMKRSAAITLVSLLTISAPAKAQTLAKDRQAQRDQAPDSIAQLILRLESQRRAAHLSGDAKQLADILADDFVDIGAAGARGPSSRT